MDRNTFTGLFLIMIILAGSVFFMKPSEEEIKKEQQLQDSLAQRKTPDQKKLTDSLFAAQQGLEASSIDSTQMTGPFGGAKVGAEELIVLENEFIKASISTKGGRIKSVEVKGEKDYKGNPLFLFNGDKNKFGLQFSTAGVNINTNDLYFLPQSKENITVSKTDSASLTLRLNYAENKYIDYIYSLKGDSYQVGFTVITKGMQDVVAPAESKLVLNWQADLPQKEKDMKDERNRSTAYFRLSDGGDVDELSTTKDDNKELGKTDWISFKQHYFSNVLIAKNSFNGGSLKVTTLNSDEIVKSFAANMELAFNRQDVNSYPMAFYFGPNKYSILKDQGLDLEKQINMGWGPMKWINRFITLPVFNLLEGFNWNYGLIILVLTILLKLVLSPLTYKSYVSMAKMRVLKPEMDEIKAKVGEDNQTLLQQEYLKLYKQAGVNPMGGCIPMVLQMPFMIAFFFFFPNLFELRGESFLWMKDLSTYDSIINFPMIPVININHISLMCILMTCATLISTWYNNMVSGATGQMKYIGYFMPLIFFFVLNSYPAGLNYYYFLSTCFTFVIQFFIRQSINDEKIHGMIQANKKKPETSKKKSSFQKRMEDYMRQQQKTNKK
ncbi:membrane protein insertase YidC [Olivibacter domesticus]|uniref:Membrane protein insertase YidC n=1 Tax=Olivibacter domesticus TaxID=407022 RepID=A0A1H7IQG4_OLID1|nr:membrane protein insertase YidC [Olivibacter domesticus]SEK63015.1 YidC/Oxa1 family membrane protein insertase [Olivibacter domesticus]